MEMSEQCLAALRTWASNNHNVRELWLFGSRARSDPRPDSDVDIAVALMPPTGNDNWALAAFIEYFDEWKTQLRALLNWEVSLVAIGPKFEMDSVVRTSGVLLWRRNISGAD
jgi:predicted nucleotidyltransferase